MSPCGIGYNAFVSISSFSISKELKSAMRRSPFWDADPSQIDPEKHSRYVIERISDFGSDEEVRSVFDNEWIFQTFENHPSFFTKRMFGGLAAYLFGRQMLVLVEPTKTGRWKWHGVLICTDYAHHPAIIEEFPELTPHDVLKKWLYIDSRHEDFELTMERVTKAIARDDPRFGIHPHARKERVKPSRTPKP